MRQASRAAATATSSRCTSHLPRASHLPPAHAPATSSRTTCTSHSCNCALWQPRRPLAAMAAAGPAAAAGKENVWSYPRPPLCEPSPKRLRVYCGDLLLADTTQGWAIKETSHPPTYYLPRADVRMELLRPAGTSGSLCEYKGRAE